MTARDQTSETNYRLPVGEYQVTASCVFEEAEEPFARLVSKSPLVRIDSIEWSCAGVGYLELFWSSSPEVCTSENRIVAVSGNGRFESTFYAPPSHYLFVKATGFDDLDCYTITVSGTK